MHIFQATLATNFTNATTIKICFLSICVVGVAFMLRFLVALIGEQRTGRAPYRLEYRTRSWAASTPNERVPSDWIQSPATVVNPNPREYDRVAFVTGTSRALKNGKRTVECSVLDVPGKSRIVW